jgi:hypothetical protein
MPVAGNLPDKPTKPIIWTCPNCITDNEDGVEICIACFDPRATGEEV